MNISTEAGRLPVLVATFFGAGFSPVAPGTVGSLAALPLAFALLHMDIVVATSIVVGLYFLGLWSANQLEKVSGQHDAQMIVIDEAVGVCVSALLLSWWFLGVADPYLLLLLSFLFLSCDMQTCGAQRGHSAQVRNSFAFESTPMLRDYERPFGGGSLHIARCRLAR